MNKFKERVETLRERTNTAASGLPKVRMDAIVNGFEEIAFEALRLQRVSLAMEVVLLKHGISLSEVLDEMEAAQNKKEVEKDG